MQHLPLRRSDLNRWWKPALIGATALAACAAVVRHQTRKAERDCPPLGRFVTVDEEFYRWDTDRRATFRIVGQSRKVLDAMAEDFLLEPVAGGTDLTWTMALSPLKGAGLPLGVLAPLLRPGNVVALGGIKKILR